MSHFVASGNYSGQNSPGEGAGSTAISRSILSPFSLYLHHKSTEWKTYSFRRFFQPPYIRGRTVKDPHKISFSEPAALLCL